MGQTEAVCPHCGYDFPEPPQRRPAPWWATLCVVAAWAAVVIFVSDQIVRVVSGLFFISLLAALQLGAWRFLRGRP